MSRRERALLSLVAGLVLGLLACGRSPAVRYYTLRPMALGGDAGPAAHRSAPVAVAVGPAELPRYLQRPEIVWRSGASRLEYEDRHRWADDLESQLLRALGRNLTTLLGTDRIVIYPAEAPFQLDYRITLDVQQFEAGEAGELILRARWVVFAGGGGEPVAVEVSEVRRSARPQDKDDLVQSYAEAVGDLSQEIAKRLRDLQESDSPSP